MTSRTLALLFTLVLTACPGGGGGDGGSGGGSGGSGGSTGGSGGSGGSGGGDPNATLSSLAITPGTVTLGVTETQALTATGTFSDGSMRDLSSTVTWASSAMAVLTVTPAGLITAVTEGTSVITATKDSKTAVLSVTVSGQALTSIEVGPAMFEMGVGATTQFVANGTYADTSKRNITAEVTWTSSAPAVAGVNATGVVTALTMGTTNLTATLRGKSGSTMTTVGAKTVTAISITPRYVSIKVGDTKQLTATGTYSDGTTANITSTATWSIENVTNELTITPGGLVTGGASRAGLIVHAKLNGVDAVARVSVTTTEFALTALTFTPEDIPRGLTRAQQLPDAVYGMIGSTNYGFVTWTSSNPAVVRIEPNLAWTGVSVGTSTMTAVTETTTGTLMVSGVVHVIEPSPDSITVSSGSSGTATVAQGSTLKLTAMGVSSFFPALNADLSNQVMWTSSNMAAATVDTSGLVRGVGTGMATITAKLGTTMGSTTVNVPSNVPPTMMSTLGTSEDNSVFSSSVTAGAETMVYPTNAFFPQSGIGVGCAWYWNPPIGPAPERFDATCSEGLIKFDLSSLAGKTVVSARLRLTTSAWGIGSVPRKWSIYALATQWSGASVTWYSASSFQHYVYSETAELNPPTYGGQVFDVDVTNTVKNWVSGAYVNAGLRLGINNYLYPYLRYSSLDPFEFYSREDANGRGPKLVITYQ